MGALIVAAAVLELKITLVDIKPPIWRRLVVPNQITLKRLHESIQAVVGWRHEHPHEFVIAGRRYGRPAPREIVPVENEALFRLHSLPLAVGTSFTYVYDFAAHWEIELKVERVGPPDPHRAAASVLGGARAFPPEDSGGAQGYKAFLQALSDPADPGYEECRRLAGDDFDPERLDLQPANERLGLLLVDRPA